jgi:hypothetical protein
MKPTTRLSVTSLVSFLPLLAAYLASTGAAFAALNKQAPGACAVLEKYGFLPCQAMLGLWALVFGAAVKFGIEYVSSILPLAKLDGIRKAFSDRELKPIVEEFANAYGKGAGPDGEDLPRCARLSLMLIRRPWRSLFLRAFSVLWTCGFDEEDPDRSLVLWLKQGVAGMAVRERRVVAAHVATKQEPVKFLFKERPWGLFGWQMAKVPRVRWVLSVPIYGPATHANVDSVAGVINLDVTDSGVAARVALLKLTDPVLSKVCEGMAAKGHLAARLW